MVIKVPECNPTKFSANNHTSVRENFCGINPSAWSPRRGEADGEEIHHDDGKVLSAKIIGTSVRVWVC
jgi:hypothetical protein